MILISVPTARQTAASLRVRFTSSSQCWLITFWLAIAVPPVAGAQTPTLDQGAIPSLVKSLDSQSLAERNAAEKRLTEMGGVVLEYLHDSSALTSEVSFRIARIRQTIERAIRLKSISASQIQSVAASSDEELGQQFFEQTGNHLVTFADSLFPRNLKLSTMSFWEAIELLETEYQWLIDYQQTTESKLVLKPQPPTTSRPRPASQSSGPFRFEWVTTKLNTDQTAGRVALRLLWEPRIRPLGVRLPVSKLAITDERARAWAIFSSSASLSLYPRSQGFARFDVPFRRSQHESSATTLRGAVEIVVLGERVPVRFRDVTAVDSRADFESVPDLRSQSFADVVVTLQRKPAPPEKINLQLNAKYDPQSMAAEIESHFLWRQFHEARLVPSRSLLQRSLQPGKDAATDGIIVNPHMTQEPILPLDSEQLRQDPYEFAIQYTFQLPTPDSHWDLVFVLPCGVQSVQFPFEIRRP